MANSAVDSFIDKEIKKFLYENQNNTIVTRFPPEPNGFLHIGHAKAICLNFNLAKKYEGLCYLRFDNTNPKNENNYYINSIKYDIKWLGFKWDKLSYASDYFEQLITFAIKLIEKGDAYVCSLKDDDLKKYRGNLKKEGKNSPDRNRSIKENLSLFKKMTSGLFKEGSYVLRAKIDMASSNMNMRDPVIYRILKKEKVNGYEHKVFPMYDFAHSLSDAIENITHSICTLEFEDHRPLYNWFIKKIYGYNKSQQIEFSRLNVSYLITSKRVIKYLVEKKIVEDWDDPRIGTISGMRNRGFTANAIKNFCYSLGISKSDSLIHLELLEKYVREDLDRISIRRMAVINPILVSIINLENDEILTGLNHPKRPELGSRKILFSKHIYIERSDFCEHPHKKYKRLTMSNKVRLRYGYVISCQKIIKDNSGNIIELVCSYDKETFNKKPKGYKISGVIHWVSKPAAKRITVVYYNNLFNEKKISSIKDMNEIKKHINHKSKIIFSNCFIEPELLSENISQVRYQFERVGYFFTNKVDMEEHVPIVFKRILELRSKIKIELT